MKGQLACGIVTDADQDLMRAQESILQDVLLEGASTSGQNRTHLGYGTMWSLAYDMSIMADDVYKDPGWKRLPTIHPWRESDYLVVGGDNHPDHLCIYRTGGAVVMSISGSNDFHDWLNNFQAQENETGIFCGLKNVHTGFAKEASSIFDPKKNKHWPRLRRTLEMASADGDEIVLVGHSLGGAVASLLAACANRGTSDENRNSIMGTGAGFHVDLLFTFGAPGISQDDYKIGAWEGGEAVKEFSGVRIYNEDERWVDAVPAAASAFHYKHASDVDGVALSRVHKKAKGKRGKPPTEPYFVNNPFSSDAFKMRLPSAELHSIKAYSSRLELLSETAKVEDERDEGKLDELEHQLDETLLKGHFFSTANVVLVDDEVEPDGPVSEAKAKMRSWLDNVESAWDSRPSFW